MESELKKYIESGLSLIPLKSNKTPAIKGWKKYQKEQLSFDDIEKEALSYGIICGYEGLEAVDIDLKYDLSGDLDRRYSKAIAEIDDKLGAKPILVKTVNNGYHLIYKTANPKSNTELASRNLTEEETAEETIKAKKDFESGRIPNYEKRVANLEWATKILIETRGEGGYIVAAFSKGYKVLRGDMTNIPTLSESERNILFEVAKGFDITKPKQLPKKKTPLMSNENEKVNSSTPIDDFNKSFDIIGYLRDEGWVVSRERGDNIMLTRPGKDDGSTGASYIISENKVTIFSSSTNFDVGKKSAFDLVMEGDYQGDYDMTLDFVKEKTKTTKKEFVDKKEPVKEVPISEMILPEKAGYKRLNQMIRGEIEMGLPIGIPALDDHLRFKENQYLLVVGKQNIGKTFTMLWYMHELAVAHGKKFLIFSMENSVDSIKRFLLQFHLGKEYVDFNELNEGDKARDWIHEHFRFFSTTARYSFKDIIGASERYYEIWKYDSLFIDPYNALEIKLKQVGLSGTYEYHMEAANVFQFFAMNTTGIILNCHVISSAQREGERPRLDHVQGGTAFTNKAHDGIVVHRNLYDKEKMTITEISVEKIKDAQTGGMWTGKNPVELRVKRGMCGFIAVDSLDDKAQQKYYEDLRDQNGLTPMAEAIKKIENEGSEINEDPAPF